MLLIYIRSIYTFCSVFYKNRQNKPLLHIELFIKNLKKTRAGLRMSKKSCNFARNFAEGRISDRKQQQIRNSIRNLEL